MNQELSISSGCLTWYRGDTAVKARRLSAILLMAVGLIPWFGSSGSGSAHAAFSLTLTPASRTVQSSTGGTVSFTGIIDGDPGEQLQTFDIVIDIAGRQLPSSDVSIVNLTPLVFAPLSIGETERNGDDIFFGGLGVVPLDASSDLQIFTFDAVFRSGIAAGQTFDFNFASTDTDFSLRSGIGLIDLSTVQFNNATVTISAVPEPSGICALVGLVCGCAMMRRRRRTALSNVIRA
ncbi:PEP-CTERM sorting domain-containing protein [Stieleria varia]|uniref:PEP-CTERM protein-sorting domain-containing protein n=1 Tax=Stieleria varia TaxID=2528005 RepID=A0A5C6ATI0_9BACT|nr:PEP-CTERM sorting domain-containing protein [Stieleria varia]TWU02757.1 hypothetical protein Pla52n_38160 [Stieleria varia]